MRTRDVAYQKPIFWYFSIYGHGVTLTFDLLTPKSNQFIYVPKYIKRKSPVKIRQCRNNIPDVWTIQKRLRCVTVAKA